MFRILRKVTQIIPGMNFFFFASRPTLQHCQNHTGTVYSYSYILTGTLKTPTVVSVVDSDSTTATETETIYI